VGLIQTRVYVDFDGDLDFSDANEDITQYVTSLVVQRGTDNTLNAGSLELMVYDPDGRFQPQHSGGPYGEGLTVGRRVEVTMSVPGGVEIPQFYGFIDGIAPEYVAEEEHVPLVSLTATDLLRPLEIRKITTGTLVGMTTGQIVDLLLNNLGWEPGIFTLNRSCLNTDDLLGGADVSRRYVDTGRTVVPYCQWENIPIATVIRDIVAAERGNFFVGKDGWVHYEDRHHRSSDRTSQGTLTDEHISEMVVRYADEDLFNHVEVVAHPRSVGAAGSVVFDAIGDNNGHRLAPSETREYHVSYTDRETGRSCEATNIITPVAPTDYAANSKADGTGTDMTGSLGVTFEADENERYKFTLINNHSTQDIYVTKLQVRATPLVTYDAVAMTATDELSIVQYLQRDMTLDSYLLSNPLEVQDYAAWLLYLYKNPRARVERLTLIDSNLSNALQIINREISDRVTVDSDKYRVHGDYFIDGITLEADSATGQVRCNWTLNVVATDTLFFTLNADALDSEAVLGY